VTATFSCDMSPPSIPLALPGEQPFCPSAATSESKLHWHANIAITLDLYGHPMPGSEDEGAGLLDAYLERANTGAPLAQVSG
jgi:hypothetical protein